MAIIEDVVGIELTLKDSKNPCDFLIIRFLIYPQNARVNITKSSVTQPSVFLDNLQNSPYTIHGD